MLKNRLLQRDAIAYRMAYLEQKVQEHDVKIDFFVRTSLPPVEVRESSIYHDRFLIIDENVYHLGASLKDLGKKLFAFSRLNIPYDKIVNL